MSFNFKSSKISYFAKKKKPTKQKLQLQRNPWLNHSPNFCSQTILVWFTITNYCLNIKCVFFFANYWKPLRE